MRRARAVAAIALMVVACARVPNVVTSTSPSPSTSPISSTSTSTSPEDAAPAFRLPDDVRPTRYRLELVVDPRGERFSGVVEIAIRLERPRRTVWLHARGLAVQEASATGADGEPVAATVRTGDDLVGLE